MSEKEAGPHKNFAFTAFFKAFGLPVGFLQTFVPLQQYTVKIGNN